MPKKKHFWQLIDEMAEGTSAEGPVNSWSADAEGIAAFMTREGHRIGAEDVASELRHYVPPRCRWNVEHLGQARYRFTRRSTPARRSPSQR